MNNGHQGIELPKLVDFVDYDGTVIQITRKERAERLLVSTCQALGNSPSHLINKSAVLYIPEQLLHSEEGTLYLEECWLYSTIKSAWLIADSDSFTLEIKANWMSRLKIMRCIESSGLNVNFMMTDIDSHCSVESLLIGDFWGNNLNRKVETCLSIKSSIYGSLSHIEAGLKIDGVKAFNTGGFGLQ